MLKSRTAVLLASLTLVLAACGASASSPSPSIPPSGEPGSTPDATPPPSVDHPTGRSDVLLRFEESGGFGLMNAALMSAPIFTLYGDGTVIYRDLTTDWQPPDGPVIPERPFRTATLTEAQVQELLAFAANDGGLGIADPRYEHPGIADAPWSTFTIRAGTLDKRVEVYALGITEDSEPDAAVRTAFARLADRLRAFDSEGGLVATTWTPDRYRAILVDQGVPGDGQAAMSWPWTGISLEGFETVNDPDLPRFPIRTLSDAEAEELGIEGIEGGVQGLFLELPNDAVRGLILRPLLPDEER